MEIITNKYTIEHLTPTQQAVFTEDSLFFDIECVGLSPKKSEVYLIGCASRRDHEVTITLFFANNLLDEKEVLESFDAYLNNYTKVISFNGTRFDEPFIAERMRRYGLTTSLSQKSHLDLYLAAVKNKTVLDLENYKQKTIEKFLGLYREDQYNGGELIPIYHKYAASQDEDLKKFLLLHNFEDVKGMIDVIEIMSYSLLLDSNIKIISSERDNDKLEILAQSNINVPKSINKIRDYGVIIVKDNTLLLSLNIFNDTLNTYLTNYQDYVYLVDEDMVVPKQIAGAIDNKLKIKAKKENCKVSLESEYVKIPFHIPLSSDIKCFRHEYKDKECYIQLKDINEKLLLDLIIYTLKH